MKYTSEIEINSPVDRVIELFDNPNNMDKWMKGLQSFEPISGKPGQVVQNHDLNLKWVSVKLK
ncbi:SRPBCC family protein [Chryseobacterium sp. SL1]|uniref:SRPBCC family protein n=1 Tax=Chryseobacterium sp. SL1 TaxID=2995159 RepID=UPI002276A9BC|nr:SRPBCC family protein [Chryseobacterium sp. SL1]MCY1660222.1 SRPBCC family protein [Chryseobacterium sp. SL1]